MSSTSKLFQPLRLNANVTLSHRVVMAPLTRYRAHANHVPSDLQVEYYKQRSIVPGSLLITEATFIAEEAGGYENVPGIWNEDQVSAWRKVTDAVHQNKSFISLQLWALGRAAYKRVLDAEGGHPFVSASDIPIREKAEQGAPRPLTVPEIAKYRDLYATAAKNAIRAGFDFVEIHGANGYLIDQFLQDVSNTRTDDYGGSIENRARFALEVVKAVTEAVGHDKTGIRLGPFVTFQDMHMKDPVPTFTYLIKALADQYSDLAYLHVIEPEATGADSESTDFARAIWQPRPYFSAQGYDAASAIKDADAKDTAIVFGRYFISTPDLPYRIQNGLPLNPFNVNTFYLHGPDQAEGYTDYPLHAPKETVVEA